jgi:hypothetical protein
MIELQGQNSELLANQQLLHDELIAISRTSSALDKENERLVQLFKEKLIEISAKLKGSEEDVKELATTIDSEWWDLNKAKFSK